MVRYFLARRFEIGENWIDFETEMSSVIQALDAARHMVETTIYYYSKDGRDKSDYERKISNLIKVIGEDELIKRTCGPERTIIFKMQQDMV